MKDVWFKNPWVWLIIALPLSSVIAGIATIIITSKNQPEMVVDDYYKKGKAINMEMSLYEKAKTLGISLELKVEEQRVVVKSNKSFPALKAEFTHPTLGAQDFTVMLTRNAKGQYTSLLDTPITGKWQLVISAIDNEWKIRTTLGLPTSDWIMMR